MPSKIKIRVSMWEVSADDGTEHPPFLGLIGRNGNAFDTFTAGRPNAPFLKFNTFAEAVAFFHEQASA